MSIQAVLEEMRTLASEGPLRAKELVESGKKLIGCYCTYMPWEIVAAADCFSAVLCARSDKYIPDAETVLPRNLCPLIKASYGHALTGTCPYLYFCDLVVGETTCDGKIKMYEMLEKLKDLYLIHLPRSNGRPEDVAFLKQEFIKFKEMLERRFNVQITDEKLSKAIDLRNRERAALARLWNLGAAEKPLLTGREIQEFSDMMSFMFDKEKAIEWLNLKIDQIEAAGKRDESLPPCNEKPRILITGCPINGAMKVIDAIEEAQGQVVVFENCGGLKEMGFYVDQTIDPMEALARKYVAIGCSIMSPNDHRFRTLQDLIQRFKIDGVVDVTLVACHSYSIETSRVRELCQREGVGYLNVETDFSQGDKGQLATRLGAFIEMLS